VSPTVLISAPYLIPALDRFQPVLDRAGLGLEIAEVRERLDEADLLGFAGRIDGVACGDDAFSAGVLEAFAPRLKVISKWGTGIDSIDCAAASRLGIQVFNTPDAFTQAVADSVLGYILAFARNIPRLDREMKAGGWTKLPGRALHECTLGVVGVGRIGREVLRRAGSFGMRLLGNDIVTVDPAFLRQHGVSMVGLEDLLEQADFVSLNCDLNPSSEGLIDRRSLSRMKPTSILINTARGKVVVEADLVDALRRRSLAGAALDVFEAEPLAAGSPLRTMDQVLLAPHNSNASQAAWERVHRRTLGNLLQGLGLEPPSDWLA
jgi:D-3-phosphoglycerate dehydrogenase